MSKIIEAKIYKEYPEFQASRLADQDKYITLVVQVDDRGPGWYTYDGGTELDRERLERTAKTIIGSEFDTGIMYHPGATYQLGRSQ